jgi:hypothetical protein
VGAGVVMVAGMRATEAVGCPSLESIFIHVVLSERRDEVTTRRAQDEWEKDLCVSMTRTRLTLKRNEDVDSAIE